MIKVFRRRTRDGVVIAPSTKDPGRVQLTYFDERGFYSDHTAADFAAAVAEVIDEGYSESDAAWFAEVSSSDEWRAGMDSCHRVAKINGASYAGLSRFEAACA